MAIRIKTNYGAIGFKDARNSLTQGINHKPFKTLLTTILFI